MKKVFEGKSKFVLYMLSAQALFMLSNLFINYKIEKIWAVEGFAIYNLLKRFGSFVVFPLVFGVGIGIPRYISFLSNRNNEKSQSLEYLFAGLIIFVTTFLFFLVVILIFPELILSSFKSTSASSALILVVALFVFSQGVFVIISSFFRGKLQFGNSSVLHGVVLSFLPAVIVFFSDSIVDYFFYYSISSILVLVVILFYTYYRKVISFRRVKFKLRQLVNYGSPRVVGDLVLFSFDFIPIYLVSIFISLEESGYLSLSFMFFKLATVSFDLVGSFILPAFGKDFKNCSKDVFIKKVNRLLLFSSATSVVMAIMCYAFIPFLIESFFNSLSNAIVATQYIFIAFPFYVVFIMLKNVLDIISNKAYSTLIQVFGFVLMMSTLFYGIFQKEWFVYRSLTVIFPYCLLGILTYIVWTKQKQKLLLN